MTITVTIQKSHPHGVMRLASCSSEDSEDKSPWQDRFKNVDEKIRMHPKWHQSEYLTMARLQ
jgi:hypothetical protein